MILFLNFAPIQFMGGAEKWMLEVARFLNKSEKIEMLYVSEKISSTYSRIVLGRDFSARVNLDTEELGIHAIELRNFIPFSSGFKEIRDKFRKSRKIYIKYELNELLIALYFGGLGVLKKIIFGIHSPFYYQTPLSFFEKLHNYIYTSELSQYILGKTSMVHVITRRDQKLFTEDFGLKNILYIPTSVAIQNRNVTFANNSEDIHIVFVGELSLRKGVDILCEVIEKSPQNAQFDIAGDGPLKDDILSVTSRNDNARYHNFLNKEDLLKLYQKADLLILPSRAEGFPLVFHEAMANGLMILDSSQVSVGLPYYIEVSVSPNESSEYLRALEDINTYKVDKLHISNYYFENLGSEKINSDVHRYLFK